jgi:hypothetical protein
MPSEAVQRRGELIERPRHRRSRGRLCEAPILLQGKWGPGQRAKPEEAFLERVLRVDAVCLGRAGVALLGGNHSLNDARDATVQEVGSVPGASGSSQDSGVSGIGMRQPQQIGDDLPDCGALRSGSRHRLIPSSKA